MPCARKPIGTAVARALAETDKIVCRLFIIILVHPANSHHVSTFCILPVSCLIAGRRTDEFSRNSTVSLEWGNMLEGHAYGLGVCSDCKPPDWRKLRAGLNPLREEFPFAPGSSRLRDVAQAGDDVTLEADLHRIGQLPPSCAW